MEVNTLAINQGPYPDVLRHIPTPPKQLFCAGSDLLGLMGRPRVTIIGSRSMTTYGRQITEQMASDLAGRGIVVISGLALGVDSAAQRAALDSDGQVIAVLPSPLDNIVPKSNIRLAEDIVRSGGCLVSEYASGQEPFKQNFIARNRIMSGLADVVLITEAGERSGTLHTSRFAMEQGKTVLAVPGNITSPESKGANNLLKTGVLPATSYIDVLNALGLDNHETAARQVKGANAHEQAILDVMLQGVTAGEELLRQSKLDVSQYNHALVMLELRSKVRPLGADNWAIF